ncbi:hypothetical protein Sango_1497600 [Sesamum angolense]|uniref:Reverse transcriptase zinc-binding domain-containing protein n=1 Tax=Sesamum angolense TaxID=2727404 RepID=A0AAE1WNC1_9LAMI|nr:hypothetical protein Sango_1497600 [Sesamum angolense]
MLLPHAEKTKLILAYGFSTPNPSPRGVHAPVRSRISRKNGFFRCLCPFVPGRLLSDNVLLAQELVHSLESRRLDADVVFKLDMAKAYDRITHPTIFYQAPGRIRVSHLAYADDLMIFTTTCRQNMELLRELLRANERVSGQLINGSKSSFIVGRQASSLQTQAVQDVLGYQLKHLPVTYLGVPLYKGNRKACLFDSIISRLRDMLQGWAMTNLSHGGRLALIQSVLQATPLHLLQACFSMAEGGLGVRSLADYVRAFSMKLWWRFRGKSSLWLEYLHGRYCRNLHPTIVLYNRNHSSVWHHLCRIRDVAEAFLFWTLGEGSVSFWHDNWLGEKPLAQLLHRDTYTMEPTICQIPIAAGQGDKIVWTGSSTGDFSTNSAWKAIRQVSPRRQLLADVWHRSLRPIISVFLWRFFQDRIPVDARMRQKGFSFPSKWTSVLAELTAVWRGMELALTHGLAPLVVEVDATTLLVADVQQVFREANGAADHLAKEAAS